DQRGEDHQGEEHDRGVVHHLAATGPRHLAQLGPDVLEELCRPGPPRPAARRRARLGGWAPLERGRAVVTDLTLTLELALHLSVHGAPRTGEQGRRDSNPQPPVLETGALPVELLPSGRGWAGPRYTWLRCSPQPPRGREGSAGGDAELAAGIDEGGGTAGGDSGRRDPGDVG